MLLSPNASPAYQHYSAYSHDCTAPTKRQSFECAFTQSRCHAAYLLGEHSKLNKREVRLAARCCRAWQDYFAVIRKRRMKLSGGKNKTRAAVKATRVAIVEMPGKIIDESKVYFARLYHTKTVVSHPRKCGAHLQNGARFLACVATSPRAASTRDRENQN